MPGKLKFEFASGGYSVLYEGQFIGRVIRSRGTYHHSNGRTYRSWSWASFPVNGRGSFQHRTRTEAVARLCVVGQTVP